ncbi:ATP-binding protein, partial [Candidatus Woesearchaeota archaeon]|nr:ATP-binding protein [Candidatus Woesearchaeota archaeon]
PKEISKNLSVLMFDTMGVFWTMKFKNEKDRELLDEWGLKPEGMDVKIFTPVGYFKEYKDKGIPTDYAFSIKPNELDASDWCMSFEISLNDPLGVLIERTINKLKKEKNDFSMDDIIKEIQKDDKSDKHTKDAAENRFNAADGWGVFSEKGTPIRDLISEGKVTVLDLSCYATQGGGWKIKSLVIGLISQKLFVERMTARKLEEYQAVNEAQDPFGIKETKKKMPLIWMMVDEAHEFLPLEGETTATFPLTTILKEGRQPGISLVLASQQPGKIHSDVMTQADVVISHRITAKLDVDALSALMQSYMREGLAAQLDNLPRVKGSAIVFDDVNEKMYPIRVRPRFTWHGGEAPGAIDEKKDMDL